MIKLIVAYHSFANMPKKCCHNICYLLLISRNMKCDIQIEYECNYKFCTKNLVVINYKKFCWAEVFRLCMMVKFNKNKSYTYVFKVIVINFQNFSVQTANNNKKCGTIRISSMTI